MNPMNIKHIVISLVVVFILFILVRANQDDQSYESPRAQIPLQYHNHYRSFDNYQSFSSCSFKNQNQSNSNRHEILQKKMKGYREKTYWGLEHPTQERTRYMSGNEFETFMREEIQEKDADVYWGAEY